MTTDASPSADTSDRPPLPDVTAPVLRPPFGRFLWYCYGGSLPARHHSWVLHDVTCRTWVLRHFARWSMVILPLFALYLAVMPAAFGVRLFTGVAFALGGYVMSLVFILIDADRRAVRAGYSYSRPSEVRSANAVERQRASSYRRRERLAQRRERRGR